ncbi:MAG: hypothetical protein DPW09_38615 [Anaerolineae bacterium]|nr:hypothetical protein [Anaerolineales bacterium]MCQ3979371.1 hypothetical protein [Anaerolineae bacterium]
MQLPNRSKAYIPLPKFTAYLLSESHAVGKSKAKFFRTLGFDETNIDLLERGLITIAQTESVNETVSTPHGEKYVIEGELQSPTNLTAKVRTVWIIETGEDSLRFVTAYPI